MNNTTTSQDIDEQSGDKLPFRYQVSGTGALLVVLIPLAGIVGLVLLIPYLPQSIVACIPIVVFTAMMTYLLGWVTMNAVEVNEVGLKVEYAFGDSLLIPWATIKEVRVRNPSRSPRIQVTYHKGATDQDVRIPVGLIDYLIDKDTDALLNRIIESAGLTQTGSTFFGSPIYTRKPEES